MSIRQKIFLFVIPAMVICSAIAFFSDRITAKHEMQRMLRSSLGDLAASTTALIGLLPKADQKALALALNKKIKIGRTGFLFVVDGKGKLVFHKKAQGKNWLNKPHIKYIVEHKNGYHRYLSPKTGTYKIAAFSHYAPKDWIVVASYFEDDALAKPLWNMAQNSALLLIPCFLVLVVIFWFLMNKIVVKPVVLIAGSLGEQSREVSESSGHVAEAGNSLAEGASSQAAALEQTSAALEQMSGVTKMNAENAAKANDLMSETTEVVNRASEVMAELTQAMDKIQAASDEMGKVIKSIDEIAFQTNLLALNAAVEAARAGEHGAGFAVVADEVRSLALRAAEAAKSTTDMLEGTIEKSRRGAELVERGNQAFGKVTESNQKAVVLVNEISVASSEQARGIDQVNQAAAEVDRVTQQMAANAEESAGASEELKAQAGRLRRVVHELRTLAGVKDSGPAARGAEASPKLIPAPSRQ